MYVVIMSQHLYEVHSNLSFVFYYTTFVKVRKTLECDEGMDWVVNVFHFLTKKNNTAFGISNIYMVRFGTVKWYNNFFNNLKKIKVIKSM